MQKEPRKVKQILTHKNLKKKNKKWDYEDYLLKLLLVRAFISVLDERCGFAVFGDFCAVFRLLIGPYAPLIYHADSWEIKAGYVTIKRFKSSA